MKWKKVTLEECAEGQQVAVIMDETKPWLGTIGEVVRLGGKNDFILFQCSGGQSLWLPRNKTCVVIDEGDDE